MKEVWHKVLRDKHGSSETTMIYVNVSDKGLAYDFNRYID